MKIIGSLRYAAIVTLVALAVSGCGRRPARLIDAVKEIPLSGAHDTMFVERSHFWDRDEAVARVDSNRQTIGFRIGPGDVAYVTLRNMGGVPLKRDTVRSSSRFPAETFLRTGTRDTNMHLTVEFADPHRPATDAAVFIRNRDSVYREFLFYER